MWALVLLIATAAHAFNPINDPLLLAILNSPVPSSHCSSSSTPSDYENDASGESEGYPGHDFGYAAYGPAPEPEHYSWDNLYLEPERPEIIVDPYEGLDDQ